jgi:hypothetical protein
MHLQYFDLKIVGTAFITTYHTWLRVHFVTHHSSHIIIPTQVGWCVALYPLGGANHYTLSCVHTQCRSANPILMHLARLRHLWGLQQSCPSTCPLLRLCVHVHVLGYVCSRSDAIMSAPDPVARAACACAYAKAHLQAP